MKNTEQFIKRLGEFRSVDLQAIKVSKQEPYSFSDQLEWLEGLHTHLSLVSDNQEKIEKDPLISQQDVAQIDSVLNSFNTVVKSISQFNPISESNPNDKKKQIEDQTKSLVDQFANIRSVVLYLNERMSDKEFEATVKQRQKQLDKLLKSVEKSALTASEASGAARQAAGETAGLVQAEEFSDNAKEYRRLSWWWLGASVCFFVSVIGFISVYLFWVDFSYENNSEAISKGVLKALFLSTLTIGLFQSLRNYSTNKHLEVLNEHRQNTLKTFLAFYNAESVTEETKSLIITQATKSMFEAGDTGYLRQTGGSSSLTLNLADIVQKISGNDK